MELDITEFFNNAAPMGYYASVAELGQDAGRITWGHACEDSPEWMLLDTDEKREAFRQFVRESGGWDAGEIAAWSDVELNALLLQWIAGDMREADLHAGMTEPEWRVYEQQAEQGRLAGRICGGPLSTDGRVYFYIGS